MKKETTQDVMWRDVTLMDMAWEEEWKEYTDSHASLKPRTLYLRNGLTAYWSLPDYLRDHRLAKTLLGDH